MAESDKLTIPRTILPSINIDDMTTLEAFTARFLDEQIFIKDASGVETPLPSQLCDAVRQTAILLAEGKSVMISATEQDLTTEQAAAMLGISRQTLIRLLDKGLIPFSRPSNHRRIRLEDLLEYKRASKHTKDCALSQMIGVGKTPGVRPARADPAGSHACGIGGKESTGRCCRCFLMPMSSIPSP